MKLTELRESATAVQRAMLEKISETFLDTGKGISSRVLHHQFGKTKAKNALQGLGGTIVRETDERDGVSSYEPTFLGILLSPKGREDEDLLVRFLEYLESLYQTRPEQLEISGDEVGRELGLTQSRSLRLYRLIQLGGLWSNSNSESKDGNWKAGVLREVDDLQSWPSKRDFLEARAMELYDPNSLVFYPERLHCLPSKQLRHESIETSFRYDVFISHSSKDKSDARPLAERLRKDGLKVWFDEWEIKPGDSIPAKIEEGLEHCRVLVLCMSANGFGSDWAQLESGTFRFRDPLNKERRFIPVRLDDAPIKGSLAQFLQINWRPADREQEYAKLLEACRPTATAEHPTQDASRPSVGSDPAPSSARDDYFRRRRDSIEKVFSAFELIHEFFFKVCVDYLSFVDILHAGLSATDADRKRYVDYIKGIGQRLREMHVLEGRLSLAGAEHAVRLMQQYRLQATEVNDMLRLQLPAMRKEEVNDVTDELFRRKDCLYNELAKALKEGRSDEAFAQSPSATAATASPIGNAWSGLRGVLQEYSTKSIKGILGKAGLPIARIEYRGTFKGPVLDEADKLVSSMADADRDRFAVGCIQEIIAFEREKAANLARSGVEPDGQVLGNLREVMARFGQDLTPFEPE